MDKEQRREYQRMWMQKHRAKQPPKIKNTIKMFGKKYKDLSVEERRTYDRWRRQVFNKKHGIITNKSKIEMLEQENKELKVACTKCGIVCYNYSLDNFGLKEKVRFCPSCGCKIKRGEK